LTGGGVATPDLDATAAEVGGRPVPPMQRRSLRQVLGPFAAMAPFTLYVTLGLFVPMCAVVVLAFQSPTGGFTFHNMALLFTGVYAKGFENSLRLAVTTAIIPGIIGVVLAHAIATSRFELFRRMVAAASGVLANFGGVNLAYIFFAAYSFSGIVTVWLRSIGIDPWAHGFNLYGFSGVVFIYMYFQIPLMVLIVTPALGGLRQSWREAAEGLGASTFRYWLHVGIPLLAPSVLGGMLLLFGSGFAAYATVAALTAGSVELAPILISEFLDGNNFGTYAHVGYAIGVGMLVILAVTMVGYVLVQRRASRWLRT
jgi:putative spermidine/putrescine transport system permease protein